MGIFFSRLDSSSGPRWGLILGNSMNSQERFSLFVDADEGGRQLTGIKIGTGKIRRLDFENFKKIPGPRDIPKYCQRLHLTFPYCKLFVIFMFFVKFGKQDGKPITVYKGYNLISSAKFREEIRQGPCFREAVKEISIKSSRIQMLQQDDNGFCAEFFFGTYIMSLKILFSCDRAFLILLVSGSGTSEPLKYTKEFWPLKCKFQGENELFMS